MNLNRRALIRRNDVPAGILLEDDDGYRFSYLDSYLRSPGAKPVSLSLPLAGENSFCPHLHPFFDGLIPEGWLLEITARTWKLDTRDRMGLLLCCCRDCIGAVSAEPLEEDR